MNKYLITAGNTIDTKLPNLTRDDAEKNDTIHEQDAENLYNDFDGPVVIGVFEAESPDRAIYEASREMTMEGYSNFLDLQAVELK